MLDFSFIAPADPGQKVEDPSVFEQVQSRFAVKVAELPDEIDLTAYMPKAGVKERYDD